VGEGEEPGLGPGLASADAVAAVGSSPLAAAAAVALHRGLSVVHTACSSLGPAGHSHTPGTGHIHSHTAEPSPKNAQVSKMEKKSSTQHVFCPINAHSTVILHF